MNPLRISQKTVLSGFHETGCLDMRQMAAQHHTDASNDSLCRTVSELERNGKIVSIGGAGKRRLYVLATYEI